MLPRSNRTPAIGACLLTALTLGACLDDGDGNLVPRTVDEDPALPAIDLADTRLHAEAFGDPAAPLVITLHGGPGSDYRSMLALRALADDGYRVVFFDQRGTGLSQRHAADEYTEATYLEDLTQVIDHYTVRPDQPLVFIGHSWGAMYATWFINEHGDVGGRVRGAILSEPGAFDSTQLAAYMEALVAEIPLTSEHLNDSTWSRQFMSAADHARADYLLAMLSYGGLPSEAADPDHLAPFWRRGAVVAERLPELAGDDFDWTTNLASFTAPVLFLRGERNTVVTLEHQQALAARYPHAEVITIPGTGHEVVWDDPEQYLAHTRAYFHAIDFEGATP